MCIRDRYLVVVTGAGGTMGGKLSLDKGRNFERKVARLFRDALGGDERIKRMWQRQVGHGNPDVYVPGLKVEAKAGKMPNAIAALEQAALADGDGIPVAVIHRDRAKGRKMVEYVCIGLDDFVHLYLGWNEAP